MVVLLLSSKGARLVDVAEPLPPVWRVMEKAPTFDAKRPTTIGQRYFKRVDTYTYVEQERSRAAA